MTNNTTADTSASNAREQGYVDQHRRDSQELRRLCAERDAIKAERDTLRAQLEAAEADAARYRWLRDRMVPEELTCATTASYVGATMGPVGVRPADDCDATEFDAAIDAARAGTP